MARKSLLLALVVVVAGAARPAPGGKGPVLREVLVVGRADAGQPWRDGATEARLDQAPELAVVGIAREGKKTVYLVDDAVTPLVVRGKQVAEKARRPWPADAETRWFAVEPHAWRQGGVPAKNGATTPFYSNVVSGGAQHGKWLGYDDITYFETPLGPAAGGEAARRRAASARPPRAEEDVWGGLGTMRYRVEVVVGGDVFASPGAEAVDGYGVLPAVHRVSIRRDDSTLGWLAAYFMVPEVFGSAGPGKHHQTERWVGADCADVLVGAHRAAGHTKVPYTSVKGLTDWARMIAGPVELDEDGRPVGDGATAPAGIAAGDIVRIDYAGDRTADTPRSWDHVALVWEDRSDPAGPAKGKADGVLDGFDLVVHMGHPMLVVQPLARQLPARVDVLRWK